jgi:hypothetical protein
MPGKSSTRRPQPEQSVKRSGASPARASFEPTMSASAERSQVIHGVVGRHGSPPCAAPSVVARRWRRRRCYRRSHGRCFAEARRAAVARTLVRRREHLASHRPKEARNRCCAAGRAARRRPDRVSEAPRAAFAFPRPRGSERPAADRRRESGRRSGRTRALARSSGDGCFVAP